MSKQPKKKPRASSKHDARLVGIDNELQELRRRIEELEKRPPIIVNTPPATQCPNIPFQPFITPYRDDRPFWQQGPMCGGNLR